jgi:hypothetical protein
LPRPRQAVTPIARAGGHARYPSPEPRSLPQQSTAQPAEHDRERCEVTPTHRRSGDDKEDRAAANPGVRVAHPAKASSVLLGNGPSGIVAARLAGRDKALRRRGVKDESRTAITLSGGCPGSRSPADRWRRSLSDRCKGPRWCSQSNTGSATCRIPPDPRRTAQRQVVGKPAAQRGPSTTSPRSHVAT